VETRSGARGRTSLKDDIDDGVTGVKAAASSEIKSLIADVEDLVAKIADLNDATSRESATSSARH